MRKFKYFKTPKVPKSLKRQIVLKEGYGKNWYSQKKKALIRDSYTCQKCGKKGRKKSNGRWDVEVHHQTPIREFADIISGKIDYENANHLANLITLCVPCHKCADQGHSIKSGFVTMK